MCNRTDWQPIETAPRDGHGWDAERDVDLWHKRQGRVADCYWLSEPPLHRKDEPFMPCWMARRGGTAYNMGTDADFSHWMPKPKAPL
jgi:hypothetical protein